MPPMNRPVLFLFVLLVGALPPGLLRAAPGETASAAPAEIATVEISLDVDASDLPRKLLRSRLTLPASQGPFAIRYPEWVPGSHAPTRQMVNMAGFGASTPEGQRLTWSRDRADRHLFHIDVPDGVDRITVEFAYITNQPTVNSRGVDCYGTPLLGIINWNALVFYPADTPATACEFTVTLTLPEGWKHATAMRVASQEGARLTFEPQNMQVMVDRPLICGRFLETYELDVKDAPPHRFHVLSDIETSLRMEDDVKEKLQAMVAEAGAFLGGFPYDSYDFLVVLSDSVPRTGLEHLDSSLSVTSEKSLVDEETRHDDFDYLVSHEFAHAWCGKYRRPSGMVMQDYNTSEQTELLWVYEGMTQYLSWVLPVRSGLVDEEEFRQLFTNGLSRMRAQKGRLWRPLEDTAVASYFLRGGSRSWSNLRRNQDYYQEGALLWLEVDMMIRHATQGKKSLADFTRVFFARSPDEEPKQGARLRGFDFDEITGLLSEVVPMDWAELITKRVRRTQEHLPVAFLEKAGWKLAYEPKRSRWLKKAEKKWGGWINLRDSVGFVCGTDGKVRGVVPGSPADVANLYDSAKIIAVDGRTFNRKRINDAVERSVATHQIELLVQEGEVFRTVVIPYEGGARFLAMKRDETWPDHFGSTLKPLTDAGKKAREKKDD